MPSDRQINANPSQRRARRTEDRQITHGLCAATPVLPGADSEAFEQLRSNLFQEYQPATETERVLVEEFAFCSWRLLRVETQTWTTYIFSVLDTAGAGNAPTQQQADGALAAGLHETDPKKLVNFFRYERTTTRDFYRVLQELREVQKERRRAERTSAAQPAAELTPKPAPLAAAAASAAAPASQAGEPAHTNHYPTAPELSGNGIGTVLSTSETPAAGKQGDRRAA